MRDCLTSFQTIVSKSREFAKKHKNQKHKENEIPDKIEKHLTIIKSISNLSTAKTMEDIFLIRQNQKFIEKYVNCELFIDAKIKSILIRTQEPTKSTFLNGFEENYALFKSQDICKLTLRELKKDFFAFYLKKIEVCNFIKAKIYECRNLEQKISNFKVEKDFAFQLFVVPFEFLQKFIFCNNLESILIFFKQNLFISDFTNYCSIESNLREKFEGLYKIASILDERLNRSVKPKATSKSQNNYFFIQKKLLEQLINL